jgi:hypothetical protein
MTVLYAIGFVFFVTFMLIVFRGAPFVPTKKHDIEQLFDVLDIKRTDTLVDLGSGDGRLLVAAAQRGVRSVGYELNPILAGITWVKLRFYRHLARVKMADFWLSTMPSETSVVFVFLATPYMKKLDNYLKRHVAAQKKPLKLVSYGMEVPGKRPDKIYGSLLIYTYKP